MAREQATTAPREEIDRETVEITTTVETTTPPKHRHKATYASDKKNGGYNVRVVGPEPNAFAGRTVPVTTRGGGVHMEDLTRLIWTGPGTDQDAGQFVALYEFKPKPKEAKQTEF
jgi:hypothetical protein